MKRIAFALALLLFSSHLHAAIKTATVAYKDGDTELEGFVAYDDALQHAAPGILVIHDWTGLQDYAKSRARQLAELGYVAFAADIYGKGVRPNDPADCARIAGGFKSNLPLLRKRVSLGFEQLKSQPHVDATRTAAIGYCFGGTTVLELARSGAKINGIVSFHGGLSTSMPAKAGDIKAPIVVCHGADDPFVPAKDVAAFKEEMKNAKATMEFHAYPDAVHSFTNPKAGTDNSTGSAYNEKADKQSWEQMKQFFSSIFAGK